MLIGEYKHTVDAKGRLIIPSRFREDLGGKFIITRGIGKCLFGLSLPSMERFSEKLDNLPSTDKDVLDFSRYFYSKATECELDKQGRVLVPAVLREFAALEKDVVVTGVRTRIEIWSSDIWAQYNDNSDEMYDAMFMKMAQLGL
jgi:MraZ protein